MATYLLRYTGLDNITRSTRVIQGAALLNDIAYAVETAGLNADAKTFDTAFRDLVWPNSSVDSLGVDGYDGFYPIHPMDRHPHQRQYDLSDLTEVGDLAISYDARTAEMISVTTVESLTEGAITETESLDEFAERADEPLGI